jgi:lipopolysaccharide biosynthesis glycosyltransferase
MINIVFSADEKYFPGLYCAIGSVIQSSRANFNFYVLDGGISNSSKEKLYSLLKNNSDDHRLSFIQIDVSKFAHFDLRRGMSPSAYSRLLMPELINDSRVIYIDSDVLVFKDLAELWNDESLHGAILCAVADTETLTLGEDSRLVCDKLGVNSENKYFNSGFLLMDLDLLRADNFSKKCLDFTEQYTHQVRYHDQSPINFLYHNRIKELPVKWNTPVYTLNNIPWTIPDVVLHYTSQRPWLVDSSTYSYFFLKYSASIGLPIDAKSKSFILGRFDSIRKNILSPIRVILFFLKYIYYKAISNETLCSSYQRACSYWLNYLLNIPHLFFLNKSNKTLINAYFKARK